MDGLHQYMTDKRIPYNVITNLFDALDVEQYDTDSLQQDMEYEETKCSNIAQIVMTHYDEIVKYVKAIMNGMTYFTSLHHNIQYSILYLIFIVYSFHFFV